MSSIETRPNSSILRRLSRGQFGLRFLLALMVVAAIGAWWFAYPNLPQGMITESQAKQVTVGMSKDEVIKLLGMWKGSKFRPMSGPIESPSTYQRVWCYGVATSDPSMSVLYVAFSPVNDTVDSVERYGPSELLDFNGGARIR